MADSKFQGSQVDLPAGTGDDKDGSDQLHNTRRKVMTAANLILQYLCVCTYLKALEKAGLVEYVRMLSATKQSKDDSTAVTFEDYQVQYFLIENSTAADDKPVTKGHNKIQAGNKSVLPYSASCMPLPAPVDGGKGSVDDSGNFTATKGTNEEDLSSKKSVVSTAKLLLQYLFVGTFSIALVVSTAKLLLQYLFVGTFSIALENTGSVEHVRMMSAAKHSKDDSTAVEEDYQVQYFLIENTTAADDEPVTKGHNKVQGDSESVLPYSTSCTPLPAPGGGGKGSVGDSGNFTATIGTNEEDLSSTKSGPPLEMYHSVTYATCCRSGSGSDDSDSVTSPPLTGTFVEYNHDEDEEEEVQASVQESSVNSGSWSHTFKHIPLQYTTDDWNFPPGFLVSPVEEDPANIGQPHPMSSLLDTGQQVSQHPQAKPPRMGLHHHSPLDTGQPASHHPLAKPPRMELHCLKDKEEVLVTPEEESVMPFSQVLITHNPTVGVDLHQQPPPGHGAFSSPLASDDQFNITDHHMYLTSAVEESSYPGASASLVTGYEPSSC